MSTPAEKFQYQVGGSLEKNAPCYVTRQADEDFYQALKAGEFCYVLNSRQMGKSSLRVRVMQRLQAAGVACAVIDITSIGSQGITAAEWYLGIVRRLVRAFQVKVKVNALEWWNGREGLSPVQRLSEFLEEELLVAVTQPIAIFIDEIDSILKLDFKDDFFALIRACYNQRAERSDYQRLTFALLGVATPSDLIQDKNRTPFNIGRAIAVEGFQLQEAQPLVLGLAGKAERPEAVLQAILEWTGGQPFLTQKLCQLVAKSPGSIAPGEEAATIAQSVQSSILDQWEAQDDPEHLKTIRDRLLKDDFSTWQLLNAYENILTQGEVAIDSTVHQMELRLSGLIVEYHGKLKVHNLIYAKIFNAHWIGRELARLQPDKKVRILMEEIRQALQKGRNLKNLNSQDPYYLHQIPYVWIEQYPWQNGQSRIAEANLSETERQFLVDQLPSNLPDACVINSFQFLDLIKYLHLHSEENQQPLSEATTTYISNRLLLSGTIERLNCENDSHHYYALLRISYSPQDDMERLYAMVEEAASYFQLLQDWQQRKPHVMRVSEWLDISPDRMDQAFQDLDEAIKTWADRYHQAGGTPVVLHSVVGNRQ